MTRREKLLESLGTRPHMIEMAAVAESYPQAKPYQVVEGVAIIGISGVLSNNSDYGDISYASISEALGRADEDPQVRAIVLTIDSPGGSTDMAFETAAVVADVNKRKPITAVCVSGAYSAAYLLASQASEIWVPPSSGGVGSIGVYAGHMDLSGMLEKMGVKVTLISAGEGKTDGNPYEPLSEAARAQIKANVDELYGEFVAAVARGRGIAESAVVKLGARLYRGSKALGAGLAGRIGSLDEAWVSAATSSSVASATTSIQEVVSMADNTVAAEAQTETAAVTEQVVEQAQEVAAETAAASALVAAYTNALTYAADVAELCEKAGLPSMAAALIRSNKPLEGVGKDLQAARVAQDSETQIHSAVLSETGALAPGRGTAANVNDSPIVKAADRLAQAGKGKS
jgi:signal peptide peptidase SppA